MQKRVSCFFVKRVTKSHRVFFCVVQREAVVLNSVMAAMALVLIEYLCFAKGDFVGCTNDSHDLGVENGRNSILSENFDAGKMRFSLEN